MLRFPRHRKTPETLPETAYTAAPVTFYPQPVPETPDAMTALGDLARSRDVWSDDPDRTTRRNQN